MGLPLSCLLGLVMGWGLLGAWGAMAVDITVCGAFHYGRFRNGRWPSIKV